MIPVAMETISQMLKHGLMSDVAVLALSNKRQCDPEIL